MRLKKFTQKDRYGNMMSYEFDVPPMEEIPHPGMPIGTDTVPAWLTPGERVMNAEAERMYGPALEEMNEHGRAIQRAQGGTIPEYAACGSKVHYKSYGGPVYAQQGMSPEQMSALLANQVLAGALDPRTAETALSNMGMGTGQAQAVIPSYTPNTQADQGIPYVPSEVDEGIASAAPVPAPVREIPDTIAMGRPYPEVPQTPGTLDAEPPLKVEDRDVTTRSLLLKHEDMKNVPYKDSEGHWTVGVGHKITDKATLERLNKGDTINYSDEQVMNLFDSDLQTAKSGAQQNFSGFNSYSPNLQDALISMNFQLGTEGTRKFKDFRAALAKGDYETAKAELDDSDWAKQTPTRVEYLKSVIDQEAAGKIGNKNTITSTSGQPVVDSRFGVESTYNPEQPEQSWLSRWLSGETPFDNPMIGATEDFSQSQKVRQGTQDLRTRGGRGRIVEQAGERAASIPVQGGRGNIIEEAGARAQAAGVPPIGQDQIPFYEDQALRGLRSQEPEKDMLGRAIDSAREFVFGSKDHSFDADTSSPEVGTVKPEMAEALVKQQAAMDARLTRPEGSLDVGLDTWAEDSTEGPSLDLQAPPVTGEEVLTDKGQAIVDDFRQRNPRSRKSDAEIIAEAKERGVTDVDKIAAMEDANIPNPKAEAAKQVQEQTKGEDTPDSNTNVTLKDVEDKGNEQSDDAKSKAQAFFEEWGLADLFNKKEIGKMVALYLGSRALGYSHGGSLNYAAKNYAQGIEKRGAAADKLLLTDKYTPESIEEYRRTGDMSVLKGKTVAPKRTSAKPTTYYTIGSDKPVKLYEYERSDGSKYLGLSDSTEVNMDKLHQQASRVPNTDEFKKASRENVTFAENILKDLHSAAKEANDGNAKLLKVTPSVMAGKAGRWATINGVEIDDMTGLVERAYRDMEAYVERTGKQPADIRPFLNQQVIRSFPNTKGLFEDKEGNPVDASKFAVINQTIANKILKSQYKDANAKNIMDQYISAKQQEWDKLSSESPEKVKKFTDGANLGESGFLLFLQNDLGIDDGRFKEDFKAD